MYIFNKLKIIEHIRTKKQLSNKKTNTSGKHSKPTNMFIKHMYQKKCTCNKKKTKKNKQTQLTPCFSKRNSHWTTHSTERPGEKSPISSYDSVRPLKVLASSMGRQKGRFLRSIFSYTLVFHHMVNMSSYSSVCQLFL